MVLPRRPARTSDTLPSGDPSWGLAEQFVPFSTFTRMNAGRMHPPVHVTRSKPMGALRGAAAAAVAAEEDVVIGPVLSPRGADMATAANAPSATPVPPPSGPGQGNGALKVAPSVEVEAPRAAQAQRGAAERVDRVEPSFTAPARSRADEPQRSKPADRQPNTQTPRDDDRESVRSYVRARPVMTIAEEQGARAAWHRGDDAEIQRIRNAAAERVRRDTAAIAKGDAGRARRAGQDPARAGHERDARAFPPRARRDREPHDRVGPGGCQAGAAGGSRPHRRHPARARDGAGDPEVACVLAGHVRSAGAALALPNDAGRQSLPAPWPARLRGQGQVDCGLRVQRARRAGDARPGQREGLAAAPRRRKSRAPARGVARGTGPRHQDRDRLVEVKPRRHRAAPRPRHRRAGAGEPNVGEKVRPPRNARPEPPRADTGSSGRVPRRTSSKTGSAPASTSGQRQTTASSV
jgi:hypothetical protein